MAKPPDHPDKIIDLSAARARRRKPPKSTTSWWVQLGRWLQLLAALGITAMILKRCGW